LHVYVTWAQRKVNRCFGGTCRLPIQDRRKERNQHEAGSKTSLFLRNSVEFQQTTKRCILEGTTFQNELNFDVTVYSVKEVIRVNLKGT
jgi:hypothetical protein